MARYNKNRTGAGNPNPTEAHKARRKGDKARRPISVTVDADIFDKMTALCEKQGISRSELINQALAKFVDGD